MKWEDLKVYHPLKKEEIKPTFKKFTKIICDNLEVYGFKLIGRKLYRKSDDLLYIIDIDTRGSWQGISENFKITFEIVSVFDVDIIVNDYTLLGGKRIEDFIPNLKNNYRINQEYELLADYLTRKIIEHIIPYFEKYKSSEIILKNSKDFKYDRLNERNENLILYCELTNRIKNNSISSLEKRIENDTNNKVFETIISQNIDLLKNIKNENWEQINLILNNKKEEVFKKLKIRNQ